VKYLSKYKNVTNVLPYIVSLSMEDLINTLMDNMVIQESNKIDSAAKITVILSSNIYLPNLSLPITFNLPVSTSLPGYENVFHNNALSFVPQVPLTSEVPVSASIEISNNYSLEEINNYSLEEMQSNEPVIENNYQGIRLNSLVNLSGDISGDDSLDGIDTTHNW
jgi:hypothetical protein